MTKILCIEDEIPIREDIVEELEDCGYEVITESNGKDGLRAIITERPDLIVCDCLMPEMTGIQLFETLRSDYPEFAHVPFVFLSAHADKKHIEDGFELGADAYLTKPINFDFLLTIIGGLLKDREIQRDVKKDL